MPTKSISNLCKMVNFNELGFLIKTKKENIYSYVPHPHTNSQLKDTKYSLGSNKPAGMTGTIQTDRRQK
jgi:hypothetical protein